MELDREPWIEGEVRKGQRHDLLFWSGGKDSFLALRKLQADRRNPVVLCTTFDGRTERVSQQELTLETIQRHAAGLGIPVLLIPLYPGGDYLDSVAAGLTVLRRHVSVDRFVFGDLHLRDIRDWREQAFASLANKAGANLYFPLWHQPYDQLLADLAASGATCRVSAVTADALSGVVSVGDVFGPELIGRLPDGVDAFGEHGEFHTGLELG